MSLFNKPRATGKPASGRSSASHRHAAAAAAGKHAQRMKDPMNGDEGLVPESVIAKVKAQGRFDLLASTTADRARWFAAFLVLGGITLFSSFGWFVADARFAENVRVAWVKLDPSGAYTVEFADQARPVEFFQTTLESKLSEFVEKRYRKIAATVTSDYRFVGYFLSPALTNQFLSKDDFNAARVAAELIDCKAKSCRERDVKVRVVQHRTAIPVRIPDRADTTKMYETLIFVTFTERKVDGTVLDRRNAIVQMGWRIRGKDEIVSAKNALVPNPLGIEVMSLELKEDPTPVAKEDENA